MAEGKHPGGRPKIPIDWKVIDGLLRIQCTGEEIAGAIGCSYDTLERRCKDEHGASFADYSVEKRAGGRASLRRVQWQNAMGGNATMQIWLGKQVLGQVEKREYTGKDGGPLRTEVTQVEKNIEDMSLEELQAEVHARSAGA